MSKIVNLVPKIAPGSGLPDGRCLPCLGVSGKAVTATFFLSGWNRKIGNPVKILCRASSSGGRKSPNNSSQRKGGISRGKSMQNEEEDDFENDEERSESFLCISNKPTHRAMATPGTKEEIVELFRKVKVQLRERAASKKGETNDETPKEESKSSDSISTLVQLLTKHSIEKGKASTREMEKGKVSKGRTGETSSNDKSAQDGAFGRNDKSAQNGAFLRNNKSAQNGAFGRDTYPFSNDEPSHDSSSRAASKFSKKSPIPQEKNTPSEDFAQLVARWTSNEPKKKYKDDITDSDEESDIEPDSNYIPAKSRSTPGSIKKKNLPDTFPELDDDSDLDSESDSETELDLEIQSKTMFSDETSVGNKEEVVEEVNLGGLKVTELRELAKSRGLKGASKLKKSELIDLLSNNM